MDEPIAKRDEERADTSLATVEDLPELERRMAVMSKRSTMDVILLMVCVSLLLPCVLLVVWSAGQGASPLVLMLAAIPILLGGGITWWSFSRVRTYFRDYSETYTTVRRLVRENESTAGGVSLVEGDAPGGELTVIAASDEGLSLVSPEEQDKQ